MTDDGIVEKHPCQSCGLPIESGPYCPYCVDERGQLQRFEERFERMVQFAQRRDPEASEATLKAQTLAYMATMPAWRGHPELLARQREG